MQILLKMNNYKSAFFLKKNISDCQGNNSSFKTNVVAEPAVTKLVKKN